MKLTSVLQFYDQVGDLVGERHFERWAKEKTVQSTIYVTVIILQ